MIAAVAAALPCRPDVDAVRQRILVARRLYAERRDRERAFGVLASVFRDPAWDIALDLYVAGEEGRCVSASSASIASRTPMSTGLRCIDRMVEAGVVARRDDPADARRSLVALTDEARDCMSSYLDGMSGARARWGDPRAGIGLTGLTPGGSLPE